MLNVREVINRRLRRSRVARGDFRVMSIVADEDDARLVARMYKRADPSRRVRVVARSIKADAVEGFIWVVVVHDAPEKEVTT